MFVKCSENKWDINRCDDPEHNPPTHLYIPQGECYKHKCPSCGKIVIVTSSSIYLY